jgi:hypothetical protein
LRAAVVAAGGASLIGQRQPVAHAAQPAGPSGTPSAASGADGCKVFRDVCSQHWELLKVRTATSHAAIAASLKTTDAKPVTMAMWQMRNQCGGLEGKRQNCRRMIEAIACASQLGVQVLAFPEMCLPGYFTAVSGPPA